MMRIDKNPLKVVTPYQPSVPKTTNSSIEKMTPNPRRGLEDFQKMPNSFFPWAIDAHNQITYIDAHMANKDINGNDLYYRDIPVPTTLTPYTKNISIERRRQAQTELAKLVLGKPLFCQESIDKVSAGVLKYIKDMEQQNPAIKKEVADCMLKYLFSKSGFGRIESINQTTLSEQNLYELCLDILQAHNTEKYPLASILAIHDFMGRVVFAHLKGTEQQVKKLEEYGNKVRPEHMFGSPTDSKEKKEMLRGRIEQSQENGKTRATTLPGICLATSQPYQSLSDYLFQERARGIDQWQMKLEQMPAFTIDLLQRNLIFGAGPSGSTGTLLQAAHLFGENLTEEQLKQYVLAIVGYLVGGGMHSYHEVMEIAALVGCPYQAGSYINSLPDSFTNTQECKNWLANYYDIAVMGGKSWNLDDVPTVGVRRVHLGTR